MFQLSLCQPWVLGTMKVVWLLAVFIAIVTYTPRLTWSGAGYVHLLLKPLLLNYYYYIIALFKSVLTNIVIRVYSLLMHCSVFYFINIILSMSANAGFV